MKFFLVILLIGSIANAQYTEEDDVLVLDSSNFDAALESFEYMMVEFYAPWCGHCQKFAPDYARIAGELKKAGEKYVPLAKLDATANDALAQKYQIKGFPTFKFFIRSLGPDQPISYEGSRTFEDVLAWIHKKTGPASELLDTLEKVNAFVEKAANTPIGIFFGTSADEELELYQTVAQTHEKVLFGHTFLEEARSHLNVDAGVKVILLKSFDEKRNDFTESFDVVSLQNFFSLNSNPSLLPFNEKAIPIIFQQQNTAIFLFADDSEESNQAFEVFSEVAARYKNKIKFSFSKPNDGFNYFSRLAEYAGASQTELPNLMILVPSQESAKYKYPHGQITSENLIAFLNDFFGGNVERYLKSEEIPENNDEPVKIVVGKNFQDLVINNEQDVLVEFYAPWCGHCKQLAPIYEQIAKDLIANPNVVLAKCDATMNEIPGVDVQSFPTLKFWKNGYKDTPISFSGDRDYKGIMSFLQNNSAHQWVELGDKQEGDAQTKQEDL